MPKRRSKVGGPKPHNTSRDLQQCLVEIKPIWKPIIDQVYKEPDLLRDLLIWLAYAQSGSPHLFTKCKADLSPAHQKLHDSILQLGGAQGSAAVVINAFTGWQSIAKRERPIWCSKRCLNTDSLRKIDRGLLHVLNTIRSQTGQTLEFKWEECGMREERYKKWHPVLLWWGGIWFCVYLGHRKLGYLNCDSGTKFDVPSDDVYLNSLPYPPNFIVPIPTSANLDANWTTLQMIIEEDRVQFLQKRWSPRLMHWLNNANKHIVTPLSVATGITVIYQLQKTKGLGLLECELGKAFKTSVCVEVNETKSEVIVYCPRKQHGKAKHVLLRLIESLQACIESSPTRLSFPEAEIESPVKLLMGAGALIHETDTHDGVENMAMLYVRTYANRRKERDVDLTEDHVMAKLTQDGFDASHVVKSSDFPRSSHWGSVMFAEYINHAAVTEELKSQGEFFCKWVRANDLYPKSLVVNFSVERRTLQQNIVCVKVATDRHLEKMKTVDWAKKINATADYCGNKEVKMIFKTSYWNFHGLRKDIEKWSGVRVAEMKHDYAAPQPTTAEDLKDMENKVKEAIKDHLDDFKNADITIDEPKTDDTEFKGRITLSDGNSRNFHGYDLEDDLENIRLRGKPVWTDGIDEVYELVVSREAYRVLQREITTELRKMNRDSICRDNSVTETDTSVIISIRWFFTDNDPPKEVKTFAALLDPSVVVGVDSRLISGREKLDSIVKIERSTKTYIDVDKVYRQANIYGNDANKKKARTKLAKLMADVQSATDMPTDMSVPLESEVLPRGIALELVKRHGSNLTGLMRNTGCDILELDQKVRVLNCRGNAQNIDALLTELENCSQHLTGRKDVSFFTRDSECCSCFTTVSADCVRLENCGHVFCMECLAMQINTYSEAKRFPIGCAAEQCDASISVCDILTICNRSSIDLAKLIERSLNCHLSRNRHRVRPCPTTDCQMFYNVTADPEEFTCPKCKNSLCSACHEPFHTGLSCDIKREIECLEDKKLKSWIQEQPKKRKMCPKCKSGIEKQMGCSNVHCASCHTYICWLCLKTFKESGDAYAHIDAKHTRRGENDWDEIEDVIGDVELEVAEEVRVAQNRAAAAAAAAGNAAAAAAPLQNGVGPAGPHHDAQEPVDPERLQGIQNQMGRVENRLQEVEQTGNVQPHRLQFLRAELEDIRLELRQLENHVREQQRRDRGNNQPDAEPQGNADQGGADKAVEVAATDEAGVEEPEPPRRVLRPRRGGVVAPPPPKEEKPADAKPQENQAELEQRDVQVAPPAPANAPGPFGRDNVLLDRLLLEGFNPNQNEALDQLWEIAGPRPPQPVQRDPLPPPPRAFRFRRPGQLLADADQIMEELEDFGQMMERIAGNRRPEEDVQPVAPLRPVPPADRPVDLGAIMDQLRRQEDDDDHEVRFRLPFQGRVVHGWRAIGGWRRVGAPNAAPDAPPEPVVPPAPLEEAPGGPLDGVVRRALRQVMRRVQNGAGRLNGAAILNVGHANNDDAQQEQQQQPTHGEVQPPVPLLEAPNPTTSLDPPQINVTGPGENDVQDIDQREFLVHGAGPEPLRIRIHNPPAGLMDVQRLVNPEPGRLDVMGLQRLVNPEPGRLDVMGLQRLFDAEPGRPRDLNPVWIPDLNPVVIPFRLNNNNAVAPEPAVVAPQANDVIINNVDIPPLVRPHLNNNNNNQQQQQQGDNNAAAPAQQGPDAFPFNILGQLMPVLDRAQPGNPLPIRRAPMELVDELDMDDDMFLLRPLRVPLPPMRVRGGPPFLMPLRPVDREARPTKQGNSDHEDLGNQIQQIIASVQEEDGVQSPEKRQDSGEQKRAEAPVPSTSTEDNTANASAEAKKTTDAKEEKINALIKRREGQEHVLIEAMRDVMKNAGGHKEAEKRAVPIFLSLQAEELNATRKMIDLREQIVNGGEAEINEAEEKVQEVLRELYEHEQNALAELSNVIAKCKDEKKAAGIETMEPQPGTSAQTAHEAFPPPGLEEDDAPAPAQTTSNGNETVPGKEGESNDFAEQMRTRFQSLVRGFDQDDSNLHQALTDAIAQGSRNADIQEQLHPILMRLDTDELTARHRMLEALYDFTTAERNVEDLEERLENIITRQREDERNALEAMQAVVVQQRNHQTNAPAGAATAAAAAAAAAANQADVAGRTSGDGAEADSFNVRVLHDEGYEQRIQQLNAERDAQMAAIKQYTSDVVEKEDLTEDDLVEITDVLNVIIRAQASQQRELLHGIPDFVTSGVRPEEVRQRIEESMARYYEEEEEALRRMREIMERDAPAQTRVLRPRRRNEGEAPAPAEENQSQTNQNPFREGLVRHVTRIVELNRQLRQESLAQNVALLEKLPKDGRLLGMVVLPRRIQPENDNNAAVQEVNVNVSRTDLVQTLRDGEAVWIPVEPMVGPPPPTPVVPTGARMERRGAIVEEDMRQDVQSMQAAPTTSSLVDDGAQPSTSAQGMVEGPKNEKADKLIEEATVVAETPDKSDDSKEEEEQPVQVRVLRNRVLVLRDRGAEAPRRARRATAGEAEPPRAHDLNPRRRGRASDPGEPPARRPRRH